MNIASIVILPTECFSFILESEEVCVCVGGSISVCSELEDHRRFQQSITKLVENVGVIH